MKKFYLLLVFLLLLTGCGQKVQNPETPAGSENATVQLVRFDIYAVNDLHGRLADTDYHPGVDELSAYLKQARQTENVILLSTGDMWQGTSESNFTEGLIVTDWMNALDFDAMTVGGHEFDWGEDAIRKNLQAAEFPFLGINVYSRKTNQQADFCQSSRMVEAEGVQIGIIGAIGNCAVPENAEDVYFKTGAELTALVKAESEKLRSEGADFIIYTIHDGYAKASDSVMPVADQEIAEYYDISLSEGYVDLVFEADTHYSYILEDSYGVYHVQGSANSQGIAHAVVLVDKSNLGPSAVNVELLPASRYAHIEDDPVVAELMEKYEAQISPSSKVLGINRQYRNNYAVSELVAKLYRDVGVERWGAEYDIVLGGGYISCRSPGYLPEGEVTYSQLQSLMPFDNRITLCSIRGSDLISKFFESTNQNYHIQTTDYGQSIRNDIDPDGIYYVVTDSYTSDYTYNNLTVIDTYDANVYARDLLAAYFADN